MNRLSMEKTKWWTPGLDSWRSMKLVDRGSTKQKKSSLLAKVLLKLLVFRQKTTLPLREVLRKDTQLLRELPRIEEQRRTLKAHILLLKEEKWRASTVLRAQILKEEQIMNTEHQEVTPGLETDSLSPAWRK